MMRGRDFLELAHHLESTRTEASHRTQISRAYYAAFLEFRAFCEEFLHHTRSKLPREHAEVAQALAAVDPQLRVDLAFLRLARNDADYELDLDAETIALQAEQARRLATSLIARLDELVSDMENDAADDSSPELANQ